MSISSRSSPRRCRRAAASRRCCGSRRPSARSVASSTGSAGPAGLAVCYEAGPGRVRAVAAADAASGVACDVVAPSLVPVRAGDRVKTDRRDAKKLVRAVSRRRAALRVAPPTPEPEGLRDLVRCRDDLRCARTAARQRVRQAAAAPRADLPRGQDHVLDSSTAAWVRRSAPGRPARAAGARAHAQRTSTASTRQLAALDARARADRASRALGRPGHDGSRASAASRPLHRARAARRDRRLRALQPPARADELPGWAPSPASTPPATSSTAATSPRPATGTPAGCSIEAAWHYRHRPADAAPAAPQPDARAPGRPRSACTTATATSPPRQALHRRRPSPSPASSPASCGPP